MKLICINDEFENSQKILTHGKSDDTEREWSSELMIKVVCDAGYTIAVGKDRFTDLENWRDMQLNDIG